MRVGAFEVNEPLPELREPHVLTMLRPWVDVGGVGSMVLARLEAQTRAQELAKLARPGDFFDFTRYRPTIFTHEGERQIVVPTSKATYARGEAHDFLFLHLLEPHTHGEDYVDSVALLLQKFGARRYCLIGSMWDMVPHTRPLLVTGGGVGKSAEKALKEMSVQSSDYQGPTSITSLISRRATETGMETMSLIVHLPQYAEAEEDYMGLVRVMAILSHLYDFSIDENDVSKAEQQSKQIDAAVAAEEQLKGVVAQLEAYYDTKLAKMKEEGSPLSPEVEKFLKEMEKRFRQS